MRSATERSVTRTAYAEVFAIREFRVLFGGNVAMILSDSLRMLALSVLVYAATHSALLAAFTYTAGFLPQVIGGTLFLSLADRLPPRALIGAGGCLRTAVPLTIAVFPLPVPAVLGIVLVAAIGEPVFSAARSGLLPEVLDGDRYVLGRSVFLMAMSGAQIVSLGGGGVLLAALGPRHALYVSAGVAALGGLWSFAGLRPRSPRAPEASGSPIRETMRGNAALLAEPRVRGLLLAQWLPVSLLTGAESLAVPYVASLGRDEGLGGVVLAALPVGILLGSVIVGRGLRARTRERLAFPLAVLVGAPLLLFGLRLPLWAALAVFAVAAAGLSFELGIQRAFVDAVPEPRRGQAFGLVSTGLMAGQGLGAVVLGGIAESIGPGLAMAAGGLGTVVAALAVHRVLRPRRFGDYEST